MTCFANFSSFANAVSRGSFKYWITAGERGPMGAVFWPREVSSLRLVAGTTRGGITMSLVVSSSRFSPAK